MWTLFAGDVWGIKKSTPITGHAGPEGSRKLRLLDFLTTAQYGGRLSALRTVRLYPQGYSWYSFSLGAESTPRTMVWSEGNMSLKNPVTPPGIDPGTVRLVAQRLNHYATPGPPGKYSLEHKCELDLSLV